MQRFRDIHKGKRIWLLASGPSLVSLDVDRIPKEDIIMAGNSGVVKANRLDYACFTDGAVVGYDYYHDLKNRDCKVIVFNEAEIFPIKEQTYFIKKRSKGGWKFSKEDTEVIYGYDIIHCSMNLAYVMGAKELILCGVDLGGNGKKYHWHDNIIDLKTNNHFHEGWPKADINYGFGAERNGFMKIRLANPDFKVINISMESTLDCWPKKPFEEIINENIWKKVGNQ